MQLADRVAAESPAMVMLSHLPPEALAQARYQVRRLRARFAGLPILVGRWGEAGSDAASRGALRSRGHARGLHAGRCPRPDPGQGRFRGPVTARRPTPRIGSCRSIPSRAGQRADGAVKAVGPVGGTPKPRPYDSEVGSDDHLAEGPPIGEPASIARSISAAPRSTKATPQNQNNSTMTAPTPQRLVVAAEVLDVEAKQDAEDQKGDGSRQAPRRDPGPAMPGVWAKVKCERETQEYHQEDGRPSNSRRHPCRRTIGFQSHNRRICGQATIATSDPSRQAAWRSVMAIAVSRSFTNDRVSLTP